MKEILREGLPELGVQPEEAALDRLEAYHGLLSQRNQVMNLTAIQGEEDTARLHFLDCAALLRHLPLKGRRLADVGSGAGFPGLVLAILEPEVQVTLLDSQQKRVAFQREVCQTLGLGNVTCLVGRAEEAGELRESFDVVASRAVARLNLLSELCLPLVKLRLNTFSRSPSSIPSPVSLTVNSRSPSGILGFSFSSSICIRSSLKYVLQVTLILPPSGVWRMALFIILDTTCWIL